ncbi:MAG: hypothetical protein J6C93_03265 [Clostridia bacterium]|nr:hypothetical protein [Clostridia bacterium]
MKQKASKWAIRAVAEAKQHAQNCMITLTYDEWIHDTKTGKIIGERLPEDMTSKGKKEDFQKFIKRLRAKFPKRPFKYMAAFEYGKRTGRPHFHVILFGFCFDDLVFYKRSKRGNSIYRSKTLCDTWLHGRVCSVDSIHINAATARYCTKYISKDRGSDTFMLFSQKIGIEPLYDRFMKGETKGFMHDGKLYTIPRGVWQKYIDEAYNYVDENGEKAFDYRYVNKEKGAKAYFDAKFKRERYSEVRDADLTYQAYIEYWKNINSQLDLTRSDDMQRLLALPNDKYYHYKQKGIKMMIHRANREPWRAPRTKLGKRRKSVFEYFLEQGVPYSELRALACRSAPCLGTASDSVKFTRMALKGWKIYDNVKIPKFFQ